MNILKSLITIALLTAGMLVVNAPAAMARIVCDEWGRCWHVHRYVQPYYPEYGWNYQPYPPYPYQQRWHGEGYGGWAEHEGHGHWGGEGEED
jgi:hypothetical protein